MLGQLSREDTVAIDNNRFRFIASRMDVNALIKWLDRSKKQYPGCMPQYLLCTACGITTAYLAYVYTGMHINAFTKCKEFIPEKGWCYFIEFYAEDSMFIIIPGKKHHQILYSILGKSRIRSSVWEFNSMEEFVRIMFLEDALPDLWVEYRIRKSQITANHYMDYINSIQLKDGDKDMFHAIINSFSSI